jgi:hypothetical protein
LRIDDCSFCAVGGPYFLERARTVLAIAVLPLIIMTFRGQAGGP